LRQTRILKGSSPRNIRWAANLIRKGGLVAFPTETVYGLGADALNEKAVEKIFAAKGRPASDPLIVHISGKWMLEGLVRDVPGIAQTLMEAFWPGPLTLILEKTKKVPSIVTAGLNTVALRMPGNTFALALISEAGAPIAAPSANSFGRPSPTLARHVMDDLGGKIELIIDGGPCRIGVESTVLDVTCSPSVILRPGGIDKESLEKAVGRIDLLWPGNIVQPHSPGLLKQHYAPKARLVLFEGRQKDKVLKSIQEKAGEMALTHRVGVLVPEEDCSYFDGQNVILQNLGSFDDLDLMAKNLFSAIRSLDNLGVDYIFAIAPPHRYIGLAIFDRLYKAASSQLTVVN
jgi:L-threonylcarbamoyladenylate synthase